VDVLAKYVERLLGKDPGRHQETGPDKEAVR
jgi:hypothetical protein